jgi:hypothetical protein
MKLGIAVCLIGSSSIVVSAQSFTPSLDKWDKGAIHKAKAASFSLITNKQEQDVIFYCNLARLDGQLFVQTVLKPYLELRGDTSYNRYKQSLITDLNSLSKLNPLRSSFILNARAKAYAKYSGRNGITGHANFSERFAHLIRMEKVIGENCAYGQSSAIETVIALLIDEGTDLGHRKNILSKSFTQIGVGNTQHKQYGRVTVIDFSGRGN